MRSQQLASFLPLNRKFLCIYADQKNIDICNQFKITLKLKFHLDSRIVNQESAEEGLDWLLHDAQEKDVFVLHICGECKKIDVLHILENIPPKVTMFVSWESGKELGLRYKFFDNSEGLDKIEKTVFGIVDNLITWKPVILETENTKISELFGTCVVLISEIGLTKMLNYIFSTMYSYSINFAELLSRLKSLQRCNKFQGNIFIETSKYVDIEVPIGRFLSAPI